MIHLVPMTADEFEPYLTRAIAGYAADNVKAGYWNSTEALQRSEQEFKHLLPEGVATAGNYLYSIKDPDLGENVGMIWLAALERGSVKRGFIYDFKIVEAKQGRGYGRQALQAIDDVARSLGLPSIGLHVFAHNSVARHLYETAGYEVASLNMVKRLD